MAIRLCSFLLALIVFLMLPHPAVSAQCALPGGAVVEGLAAHECAALEAEMTRTGRRLTIDEIEAIRGGRTVDGLRPEEIQKGRELLMERGRNQKDAGAKDSFNRSEIGITTMMPPPSRSGPVPLFERYQAEPGATDEATPLKPFGYDLFTGLDAVSDKTMPVASDYVIGPGDEIGVTVWGRVNGHYTLTVDREGGISLPNIGTISVAGMTYEETKSFITKKAGSIVGAQVSVTMGKLRSVGVFVLGDVRRPGSYSLGAMSTITSALMAAGGPSSIGSLRRVELKRGKSTVKVLDLYELFLNGDRSGDLRLQAGDVVFVPPVGAIVGVSGDVRRPAVYELKEGTALAEAVALAGGLMPTAYTQRVQVARIERNLKRTVADVDATDEAAMKGFILGDGDLVKVFPIVDADANAVTLSGNVKRPGKYEIKAGTRLRDVLRSEDDLLPETYFEYGLVKRQTAPGGDEALIPFELGAVLSDGGNVDNLELRPRDSVFVFSKWLFMERPSVTIEGEVRCAEKARTARDGVNEDDERAVDGEKAKQDLDKSKHDVDKAILSRQASPRQDFKKGRDRTGHGENGDKGDNGVEPVEGGIQRQDVVRVEEGGASVAAFVGKGDMARTGADLLDSPRSRVRSEPAERFKDVGARAAADARQDERDAERRDKDTERPIYTRHMPVKEHFCRFNLQPNATVRDLVLAAGGLSRDASHEDFEVYSTDPVTKVVTLKRLNLSRALVGADDNVLLYDRDRVVVHSIFEKAPKLKVAVSGEVSRPGVYEHAANMTVSGLVFAAGGLKVSAYLDEAELASRVTVDGKNSTINYVKVDLRRALAGEAGYDLLVGSGDALFVKRIPEWGEPRYVDVKGEVVFPGRYIIKNGETLSSVLVRAGGYTPNAYLKGAVFTRVAVKELQQRQLNESIDRLEKSYIFESGKALMVAASSEEAKAQQAVAEQKKLLIDKLRSARAIGRVTLKFDGLERLKGSSSDVPLESGDVISIPPVLSQVQVIGAVFNQTAFVYNPDDTVSSYIRRAGGMTRDADPGELYVLKVDGSAISSRMAANESWYGSIDSSRLDPGDTVVVPEKIERIAWLREAKDITQILYQIAVTAGVLIVAF